MCQQRRRVGGNAASASEVAHKPMRIVLWATFAKPELTARLGAVLGGGLAVVADAALVLTQRALTPWARVR